jgi:hypothetical protein
VHRIVFLNLQGGTNYYTFFIYYLRDRFEKIQHLPKKKKRTMLKKNYQQRFFIYPTPSHRKKNLFIFTDRNSEKIFGFKSTLKSTIYHLCKPDFLISFIILIGNMQEGFFFGALKFVCNNVLI